MKDRCRRGYDRLAPWYQTLERLRFGNALQKARVSLLPEFVTALSQPPAPLVGRESSTAQRSARVLFLGDGDGRLLDAFLAEEPDVVVTSVDISRRMLGLQRLRVRSRGCRVRWHRTDVQSLTFPANSFDAVVTPFFLDCFDPNQLNRLLPRIAAWATADAIWYYVDFQEPQRGVRRAWGRFWLHCMHTFFRWQTGLQATRVIDPSPALQQLGFAATSTAELHVGMLRGTLYRRAGSRGLE